MCVQSLDKICKIKAEVQANVPNTASSDNIWEYLGWSDEASEVYSIAIKRGIDLRPFLAPLFSDIVSLVVDGHYIEKGHSWDSILTGDDHEFIGKTPKERMLSVINNILINSMNA